MQFSFGMCLMVEYHKISLFLFNFIKNLLCCEWFHSENCTLITFYYLFKTHHLTIFPDTYPCIDIYVYFAVSMHCHWLAIKTMCNLSLVIFLTYGSSLSICYELCSSSSEYNMICFTYIIRLSILLEKNLRWWGKKKKTNS